MGCSSTLENNPATTMRCTPEQQKHIPFVVVSAYPRPLVRTEPGQEILQKPVPRELLCGRVEAACKFAA